MRWLTEVLRTSAETVYPSKLLHLSNYVAPIWLIEVHEIYEVKPDAPQQCADGCKQVEAFRELLQSRDKEYVEFLPRLYSKYLSKIYPRLQNKTWTPGTIFCPLPTPALPLTIMGYVRFTYTGPIPGLILWKTDAESGAARETAKTFASDHLRSIDKFPSTEEEARKRARELVQTNDRLRNAARQFVLAFGIAVVVIALSAVLSEGAAIALVAAIVFTFVYSIIQTAMQPSAMPIRLS